MIPEELTQRNDRLRKLRQASATQKQEDFQEKWKDIIAVLKKTKSEFSKITLDNLNEGIPPQGKALEFCNELLAKSLKPTPTQKKKTTNAKRTNNRTSNKTTRKRKE